MIRQPEFVTEEVFEFAKTLKKNPLFKDVKRIEIEDGKCLYMMHIGSFDDEIYSFEKMKSYLETHGLERRSLEHREIYLSDFRRVEKDKLKTVLRYFLK